ncbi:MAG: beta-galactosidase, partial [Luteolibacter sp.]
RTDFDWSGFVKKHSDAPVVSHEIGQWCVYPNFREIGKYTGFFKARNFEIFQETARRNGLLEQADDFLMASGKLQALAYKHDIEAALRTPGFGGFQLLDLHDFPGQGTALVGVLDVFWDEKGYISPEEYRRFCGPVVPLARMKKLVFTTVETLEAELELAQFGPDELVGLTPVWGLTKIGGEVVAQGRLPARDLASGELHPLGAIRVPLSEVNAPAKLTLTVGAEGKDFSNAWEIFIYPAAAPDPLPAEVLVTRDFAAAKKGLSDGKSVLWMPPSKQVRNDPEHPLTSGFSPIFWNTAWTKWQAPHTLGILCDPKHPALAHFPTDMHSNWQWWELQQDAQPFILTGFKEMKPIVQVIDDWFTNRKLGYIFEARMGKGRLLACSLDLKSNLSERPAATQLRYSLIQYMREELFVPALELGPIQIETLLRPHHDH